jgi:hypothetical protein
MYSENWKRDFDPEAFWALVRTARGDLGAFRAALERLDRRALIRFSWAFEEAASRLGAEPFRQHADPALSEDAYDDLAEWVVGQGREHYEHVLAHPEALPNDVDTRDPALRMRYEAGAVFAERFGDEIPPYGYDY